MFRGRRRFVVLNKPGMLWLELLRQSRFAGSCACYSVGAPEKAKLRVLRRGTRRDVLPTYAHDPKRFPKRREGAK